MILDRLRRKKKKGPDIPRTEFLKMKPVRNPALKWEKNEQGTLTLSLPLQQEQQPKEKKGKKGKKGKGGFLSKLAPAPTEKKIQLDKVGSIVWELCDGERTMQDIVERLHEEYKLLPSEAEVSLNSYFNQLSKRGLVG
ncbi:MAG: PqqD family protein, partial [Candidatus Bathyarchaeia archaeon]